MKSKDAVLIALLVVLVIVVAYQGSHWAKRHEGFAGALAGDDPHQHYPNGAHNPYTVLNKQLDAIRGHRHDGYNQPPFHRHPRGLDRYHRAGAHLTPEHLAESERELWYSAIEEAGAGSFNTEHAQDHTKDTFQYHEPAPALDYNTFITDLITDPRTRDNHQRWVEEMKPWSGTAMKVDDLEVGDYLHFTGLRRPQAVVQYNPLQLTEIDTHDISQNPKFNFRG